MTRDTDHTTKCPHCKKPIAELPATLEWLQSKAHDWDRRADVLAAEADDGRISESRRRAKLRECREARVYAKAHRETFENLSQWRQQLTGVAAAEGGAA